jgi:phosphopantothenoylcysteine decarboxylase/phosphopantothenate--cysteine ligase
MQGKSILLVIGGGIAAYKSLELIRRARERGARVRAILTAAAQHFVTPLSVATLSEEPVFTALFDLKDETEIGHIRLSREADLIIVAPASADFLAKMAHGLCDDLASTALLAADKPILAAPAMNWRMWEHPATRRNLAQLQADGVHIAPPGVGSMACGEWGTGRMADVDDILAEAERLLAPETKLLAGQHVIVTAGPTYEPLDPVRFIGNRSSGKQGYAIAEAAQKLGARVTLVAGPSALPDPQAVTVVHVETARAMLAAVEAALPADIGIFAAAVGDWRAEDVARGKIKKEAGAAPPKLALVENPDILKTVSAHPNLRPALMIGFAAETEDVIAQAIAKLEGKGCDWIVANDVSPAGGVFGADRNAVHVITRTRVQSWPDMSKEAVAQRLMREAAAELAAIRSGRDLRDAAE